MSASVSFCLQVVIHTSFSHTSGVSMYCVGFSILPHRVHTL